jgi:hypothetical protein
VQVDENERKAIEYNKARATGDENKEKKGSSADEYR